MNSVNPRFANRFWRAWPRFAGPCRPHCDPV